MLDGARAAGSRFQRGIELAVLDWGGKGPLALVHHANGFCGAVYAPIVHPLRDTHRIVLYDARGHGDSTQPPPGDAYRWTVFPEDLLALAEVLIAEGPQRSVALGIGHSFGGTATAVAAAARPELFERIVLLDPVLHPPPELALTRLTRAPTSQLAQLARSRRHRWPSAGAILGSWRRPEHPFSSWDRRALELYVQEGFRRHADGSLELKCPGEVEATIFEMNDTLDVYGAASKVEAPTLIVRAALGNFPRSAFDRLVRAMPRADLEEIEAGHLFPMETPDTVADRLLEYATAPLVGRSR